MKKVLVLLLLGVTMVSCAGISSFVRTSENTWSVIQLRDGMDKDDAWRKTIDVLSEKYEIAFIDNEAKYMRTGWIRGYNVTSQKLLGAYSARATIKFSLDGKQIRIKSEATNNGVAGFDSKLLSTLKTDIGGVLGRVTR